MADDPRVQELLDELLDGNATPEAVCASCPELLPVVRKQWRRMRRVRADLDVLFPPPDAPSTKPDAHFPPQEEPTPKPPGEAALPRIPGYEVEAVLGRGGMGIVFRARHLRLKRSVALKMALAGDFAEPRERERFQREAEAAAGLRHPNVVPIYDVGDADGRPYLTMELVEGGSLAQKLAGTPQPAREAAALLAVLAEAVHAAHACGIIHRDLKPGNVLLTADGTPKISDFGLARRLEGAPGLTPSGGPLGTPSYMAPEQARGQTQANRPAVDVYALGAILYEMLTGRPPFRGETAAETVLQVIFQDPVPPSRLNPRVPRDLETICLKCLHKEPHRRYITAAALAADLRSFLQGEAITARPEGQLERMARWVRRHPTLVLGLTASLLLATALAGAGLWVREERAATDRTREQLARLEQARRDLELTERLDAIHLNRTAVVAGHFDVRSNKSRADREYETAFREVGFGEVGDGPEGVAARVAASNIRDALVAALDDWAVCATDPSRQSWVLEVARRANPDPTGPHNRLRDPAVWQNGLTPNEVAETALAARPSPQLLVALGERLQDSGGDAIPFLKRVQEEYPGDFWANFTLGIALEARNLPEAVRYYQAALALRPGAAAAYNNLGLALAANGQTEEAIRNYQQALRINPDFDFAHYHLGLILRAQDRVDEAIHHFRRALQSTPEFGSAHYNLALALRTKGEVDEAIGHHLKALRILPDYAAIYGNLGLALADKGQLDEAIDRYQQALRLHPGYVSAHNDLGLALADKGRFDEAIEHHQQALRLNAGDGYAYWAMGRALLAQGRLREASAATRRALDLLPQDHPQRAQCVDQSERCARLLALEGRLPAVLQGKEKPADTAERLQFAYICRVKKQYAAAARLCADAFAADPDLADKLTRECQQRAAREHERPINQIELLNMEGRYLAARCAALAGCGRGEDATGLGNEERARLRDQARRWLRADLAARARAIDAGPTAARGAARLVLTRWWHDPDLVGLREPVELERLSADEKKACLALWDEVATLLKRSESAR
jgi:serine/threonine-protein kinase